jgi:SAM-dependent methyltransferase
MAHQQQIDFCKSVKKNHPDFFTNKLVVDIGSLDINGNNQYLFDDCHYLGVDLLLGKNVDMASMGHKFGLPDQSVDVVISTECFEHDQFYTLTLNNILRMLKPGGLFLFSCATTGRPEHGTRRTNPSDAPFTQEFGDWADYYKNLEEVDIRAVINVDEEFQNYAFSIGHETHDLYFWGIKKGILENRSDYSFQIHQAGVRAEIKQKDDLCLELLEKLKMSDESLSNANQRLEQCDIQIKELILEERKTLKRQSLLEQTIIENDKKSSAQIAFLKKTIVDNEKNSLEKIAFLNNVIVGKDRDSSEQIALLKHSIVESDQKNAHQILSLEQTINRRDEQIADLIQSQTELQIKLNSLILSKSWQVTKPLRFVSRLMRGEIQTALAPLHKSVSRFMTKARNASAYILCGDLEGLQKRMKARRQDGAIGNIRATVNQSPEKITWCIMTTTHVLFIAHIIAEQLRKHGWNVDIVTEAPVGFKHDWYIVLCPQMFEKLPPGEKRIAFQMEQSVSSRWFTQDYLNSLENSLAVLDYSLANIEFLASKGIAYPHVSYLPIGASSSFNQLNEKPEKTIDVLFYGDSNSSPRRRTLLDALKEKYSVTIVNEVFGLEMQSLIKQSKLVINLHYYENALLEMPRIQECLSLGVPVVSESTQDQGDYPELLGAVHFFEEGSVSAMLAAVQTVLENNVSAQQIHLSVARSAERFNFMFDRFLVAMGFLHTHHIETMHFTLPEKNTRVGLSLPETIARRRLFETVRPNECIIFDGVRVRPGWVGCGLSYKLLSYNALRQGITRLNVMEDDVILPPEFEQSMEVIHEFLDFRKGQWDVFAGVIAALHPDVKVLSVHEFKGRTFVEIDKMTSTVFNIYDEKVLKLFASWDPSNLDAKTNTIDRYLENQANLRVIVMLPFFVGHREEAHSTLWGFQNTQYSEMIQNSENTLRQMVSV